MTECYPNLLHRSKIRVSIHCRTSSTPLAFVPYTVDTHLPFLAPNLVKTACASQRQVLSLRIPQGFPVRAGTCWHAVASAHGWCVCHVLRGSGVLPQRVFGPLARTVYFAKLHTVPGVCLQHTTFASSSLQGQTAADFFFLAHGFAPGLDMAVFKPRQVQVWNMDIYV